MIHLDDPFVVNDADRGIAYGVRALRRPLDDSVLFASWCNSIRSLPPFNRFDESAFRIHRERLESIVERCGALVAYDQESPDDCNLVYGWAVGEEIEGRNVLHYVYVKGVFRKHGIASRLLRYLFPHLGKDDLWLTHEGKTFHHLKNKWRLRLDPYACNPQPPSQASGRETLSSKGSTTSSPASMELNAF